MREVNAVTARTGRFVQSFDLLDDLRTSEPQMRRALAGAPAGGELVYAIIQLGHTVGGRRAAKSFQVFLLAEEHETVS